MEQNHLLIELQQYRQWVVRRSDKQPLNALNGYYASVTNPDDWCDYETAKRACEKFGVELGFVLTDSDPFTVIDLDPTEDRDNLVRHQQIFEAFNTYWETSPSGKGAHGWVRGNIPSAVKRSDLKIELYCKDRYMTVTGKTVKDVPLADCNGNLSKLWKQLSARQGKNDVPTILESQPQTISDEELCIRAANAANGDLFKALYCGNWQGKYPSQSEADQSLFNLVAFYTNNAEQVVRIFRASALGQRDKAKRADYVGRMVQKAFDQKPPMLPAESIAAIRSEWSAKPLQDIQTFFASIPSVFDFDAKQIEFAVESLIACGAITLITGDSGSGKTTFITLLAYCIANDLDFLGFKTSNRFVLYLDKENSTPVIQERMKRLGIRDGGGFKYLGLHLDNFPPLAMIEQWVASCEPKPVIFIDSFLAFYDGKENASEDVRRFFKTFDGLKKLGAAIVILHHTGKGESTKEFRGSSDIKAAIDVGLVLNNAGGTRLTNLTLSAFKARFQVTDNIAFRYCNGWFQVEAQEQHASEVLSQILFDNGPMTKSALEQEALAKGVKRNVVRSFIERSVSNGSVREQKGEKNASLLSLAHKDRVQQLAASLNRLSLSSG